MLESGLTFSEQEFVISMYALIVIAVCAKLWYKINKYK